MTFETGLNIVIVGSALVVLVGSFKAAAESRPGLRLLGLAFLLYGGADFLQPLSAPLSTAAKVVAFLAFVGFGIITVRAAKAAKPPA